MSFVTGGFGRYFTSRLPFVTGGFGRFPSRLRLSIIRAVGSYMPSIQGVGSDP